MAVRIRLRQQGRTNRAFYRVVVTDSRNRRDGRYVEMLGWYNPFGDDVENSISLKEDRVQYWIDQGAEMTEKAEALVAKVAPAVVTKKKERELARREKVRAKRKARRKVSAQA